MNRHIRFITDQLKKDRETFSRLRGKKRLQFVWDYYKIPIIVVGFLLVFTVLALLIRVPKKNVAAYIVWVNAVSVEEGSYFDECLLRAGYDTEKVHVDLNTSLSLGIEGNEAADAQTMQVLSALFGIGDLDLFIADPENFERYAVKDAFCDLSEILPAELTEKLGEKLVYTVNEKGERIASGYRIVAGSGADRAGYLPEGTEAYAGILRNAQNKDCAVLLLSEMIRGDLE